MLERYLDLEPDVDPTAWVHDRATIIGRVRIGPETSVWPGVVLRADDAPITIGAQTSIQDNAISHITGGESETIIGDRVTVGHAAILHGCQVADDVLVGMGAILMDNAVVQPWTIVAAGALLPKNKVYPPGVLIVGRPGRVVRELTEKEREDIRHGVDVYQRLMREMQGLPAPGVKAGA